MFTSCRCFKKNQPPNNLTKLGHFQTLTSSHTQVVFIPFDVVRDGKLPVIHSIPWDGIQVWLVSPRVLLPRQAIYVHRPSPNAANWKKITMQMWIKQSTSYKALSQKKNSRHFKIMLDLIYRISKSIFQSYPCWYPPKKRSHLTYPINFRQLWVGDFNWFSTGIRYRWWLRHPKTN